MVSTRSQADQDSSTTSSKRSSRKTGSYQPVSANRQETPAQEADAMEVIEEVLSAPDEPEDRVEVVIESQERRLKAVANRTGEFCRGFSTLPPTARDDDQG